MRTVMHSVAPEEVMAWLDGELTVAEARAVEEHVEGCEECAAVRDALRGTAVAMRAWEVPAAPAGMGLAVEERAARAGGGAREVWGSRGRRVLVVAGGVLAAMVVLVGLGSVMENGFYRHKRPANFALQRDGGPVPTAESNLQDRSAGVADFIQPEPTPAAMEASKGTLPLDGQSMSQLAQLSPGVVGGNGSGPQTPAGPMIARTVALTILVKNIEESRRALDAILEQRRGYSAQLTVNTPEEGARWFEASLRVPANELNGALGAMRGLGKVENETQSGEEVTQQWVDVAARLKNARETEDRLRAVLETRAGKMDEVLQVEEQISETRGQIEQMEAEQAALEHRGTFATVDVRLTEEYRAQLGGAGESVGARMRNAMVTGVQNAAESLLALVLRVEEAGPVLVAWGVILGVPVWLVGRRYRRVRGRV